MQTVTYILIQLDDVNGNVNSVPDILTGKKRTSKNTAVYKRLGELFHFSLSSSSVGCMSTRILGLLVKI